MGNGKDGGKQHGKLFLFHPLLYNHAALPSYFLRIAISFIDEDGKS